MLTNTINTRMVTLFKKYDHMYEIIMKYPTDGILSGWEKEYIDANLGNVAIKQGLKEEDFKPHIIPLTHDAACEEYLRLTSQLDKHHIAKLFLASLSSQRYDLRIPLGALAIAQSMPLHTFTGTENIPDYCHICGAKENESDFDFSDALFLSQKIYTHGALGRGANIYELLYYIWHAATLKEETPSQADLDIFRRILDLARSCTAKETKTDLLKKLMQLKKDKIIKDSKYQLIGLLETLGFCGILQGDQQKGYIYEYINPNTAPSKSHNSDWAYPVEYWNGGIGVNEEAVSYWFPKI